MKSIFGLFIFGFGMWIALIGMLLADKPEAQKIILAKIEEVYKASKGKS